MQQVSETSVHIYQITWRHIPPWKPQVSNFTELKIHKSHTVFFRVVTRRRTHKLQKSAPEPTTEGNKPSAFWCYIPSYGYLINQSSGDEKLQRVRKIVKEERRSTISEIAGRFGLSYGTCQGNLREALYMLTDLRELSPSQAHRRVRNSTNF